MRMGSRQKTEDSSQKTVDSRQKGFPARASVYCLLSTVFFVVCAITPSVRASPSQDDVFKKIQESVGEREEVDYTPVLYLAGGGTVLVLVLWLVSRRRPERTRPGSLNHPGKLLKEVLKEVPLTAAEVRQLRLVADAVQQQTGEPVTPVTMLLCPSLLAKGLQQKPARLDRKALGQVVRKMQLAQTLERSENVKR